MDATFVSPGAFACAGARRRTDHRDGDLHWLSLDLSSHAGHVGGDPAGVDEDPVAVAVYAIDHLGHEGEGVDDLPPGPW